MILTEQGNFISAGRPVENASTRVQFPASGTYRVLVRTRDWAAPWNAPETESPGRFELLVDGEPLATVFGTEGAEWHWQEGGIVDIEESNREVRVELHDLTGFNGRCDAIVFTTVKKRVPPNEGEAMARFRRKMLGYLAGADYRYGREGRNKTNEESAPEESDDMVMGASVNWNSKKTAADTVFGNTKDRDNLTVFTDPGGDKLGNGQAETGVILSGEIAKRPSDDRDDVPPLSIPEPFFLVW